VRARRRLGLSPREVADLYALYLSTRELWPGGDAMQRIRFPLTWLQSRTGLEATVEHVRADRAAARKRATRAMGADELADKARLARETSGVESSRGWIAILPTGAAVAVEGSSASSDDEAAARAKLRRQLRGQVTRHG
ncbi:MAG: hypothetical protein J6D54_00045, partial [Olsenella sp.]|nr:hypothetical protein [Olsenella sp.]